MESGLSYTPPPPPQDDPPSPKQHPTLPHHPQERPAMASPSTTPHTGARPQTAPSSSSSSSSSSGQASYPHYAMRQNHVGTVMLHGIPIVSLHIDAKERLCLAQISNTLLKRFSYNEIHNRRVALGITCVQCTPVQLEILRRAGAMPISSRRCGMITKREAERLVKSFLEDIKPPKLPENFAFDVVHDCGWGCKGSFMPSRYNSSRAKCIKCTYCNMFFSPNKFIFHFHRTPESKYTHPDAANFNSWRRHLSLDDKEPPEEMAFAWEDVKAMFNGGSRKRLITPSSKTSRQGGMDQKRPRLGCEAPGSLGGMPGLNYPYPMIPMSTNNVPSLPSFVPRPTHPAFPIFAPESTNISPDNAKFNFADFWKGKTAPYYSPFGMFWAKNMGLSPEVQNEYKHPIFGMKQDYEINKMKSTWRESDDERERRSDVSREQSSPEGSDKYFSAFKPVGKDAQFVKPPKELSKPTGHESFSVSHDHETHSWPDNEMDNSDIDDVGTNIDDVDINVTDVDNIEENGRHSPISASKDWRSMSRDHPGLSPVAEVTSTGPSLSGQDGELDLRKKDPKVSLPIPRQDESLSATPERTTPIDPSTEERKLCREEEQEEEDEEWKKRSEERRSPGAERKASESSLGAHNIYSMTKGELQEELLRVIQARQNAEDEYMSIKEAFQSTSKRENEFQDSMSQQMTDVRDNLCHEIAQEKKARQSVQHKLKEAHDALQHFSCKMLALRHCIDCNTKLPVPAAEGSHDQTQHPETLPRYYSNSDR